jgi:hypothetical protein
MDRQIPHFQAQILRFISGDSDQPHDTSGESAFGEQRFANGPSRANALLGGP